jgi:hypothetical protein
MTKEVSVYLVRASHLACTAAHLLLRLRFNYFFWSVLPFDARREVLHTGFGTKQEHMKAKKAVHLGVYSHYIHKDSVFLSLLVQGQG